MHPDRSNYEIWLTDWMDGSLDKDQTEMLMSFLEENPDIKEEADFLTATHLSPGKVVFSGKEALKKNTSALTPGQVEFLSVAYLEKDLDQFQESELNQCISQNPESKIIFDSVQKIKLIPSDNTYPGKKNLLKQTSGTRILRLSITTLSAAATIAILILAYTYIPSLLREKNIVAEQIVITETNLPEPLIVRTKIFHASSAINLISKQKSEVMIVPVTSEIQSDTSALPFEKFSEYRVTKLPSLAYFPQSNKDGNSLIELNIPFSGELYIDDRNAFTKFLARNFREKILGDKVSGDAPIKPLEIAEAGVEGLNKLLGWDMALVAVNDKAGDLKSVYFDSKLLKFNAPVKKNESAE